MRLPFPAKPEEPILLIGARMIKTIVHKISLARFLVCIFLLPLMLAACSKSSKATLTPTGLSPDAVNTAAAQTAEARRNQTGSLTPTSPPLPTFDTTAIAVTMEAATQQALVTPSPVLTATVTTVSLEATPSLTPPLPTGQDNAVFTLKETIPDGTDFAPGATFTKSWQFMNTGQTTWTTSYSLVFLNGDQMGGPESVPLEIEVPAGRLVEVSVNLTAPQKTGSYKGNWRLRNGAGQFFGDIVYVQIEVVEGGGTSPTSAPGGKVTNVTLSVDEVSFTGSCPHSFTFSAELKLNGDAAVTFVLEFGGGIAAPSMPTETTTFSEGTVQLTFSPAFNASGSGWARLHISAPNDVNSNKVEFSLDCQP
jgi:hypothetical protein